jgi:hypothetical protein
VELSVKGDAERHAMVRRTVRRVELSILGCQLREAVNNHGAESSVANRIAMIMIDLASKPC